MNAANMYTQDYDETMTWSVNKWGSGTTSDPWVTWVQQLMPYIKNWNVMSCPSNKQDPMPNYWGEEYPVRPTYAVSNYIWHSDFTGPVSLAAVHAPADKLYIADTNHPVCGDMRGWLTASQCGQWTCNGNISSTHNWVVPHNGGSVVGYVDGHVKWLKAEQLYQGLSNGMDNPKI